jgi:hypothetical protein
MSDGNGIYINAPPIRGEEITRLTFKCLATVNICVFSPLYGYHS